MATATAWCASSSSRRRGAAGVTRLLSTLVEDGGDLRRHLLRRRLHRIGGEMGGALDRAGIGVAGQTAHSVKVEAAHDGMARDGVAKVAKAQSYRLQIVAGPVSQWVNNVHSLFRLALTVFLWIVVGMLLDGGLAGIVEHAASGIGGPTGRVRRA